MRGNAPLSILISLSLNETTLLWAFKKGVRATQESAKLEVI
jgi:hypothetical protein